MVDQWTGKWTEEKDYSTYPKEKWCDYDYMAAWIREKGYKPKTSMENIINMIYGYYEDTDEVRERGYFRIQDTRKYPDNLMVNIPYIEDYVMASDGLEMFDFEI